MLILRCTLLACSRCARRARVPVLMCASPSLSCHCFAADSLIFEFIELCYFRLHAHPDFYIPSPSFSSFNVLTVLQFVKFEEGLGMCLCVSAPPLLLLPTLLSPLNSFPMSLVTFHFCRSPDKIIPVLLCRGSMLNTRQKAGHALLHAHAHAHAHHTHLSLHTFLRVVTLPQGYCCTPLTRSRMSFTASAT